MICNNLSDKDEFVKIDREDRVRWHFRMINPRLCHINGETYDSFNLPKPSRWIIANEKRVPAAINLSETKFHTLNEATTEVHQVLNKNIATSSASTESNRPTRCKTANTINDIFPLHQILQLHQSL